MIKKYWIKLKSFLVECKRVFQVTKKPTNKEFKTIVQVTAIGAVIIGVIGAIIQIGYQLIK